MDGYIKNLQPHRYLEELWRLFSIGNKAIEEHAPWVKMKEERKDEALATVALVANVLAKAVVALHPVMPNTTATVADALGFVIGSESYKAIVLEKSLLKPFIIKQVPPLFPRVEEPLMQDNTAKEESPVAEVKAEPKKMEAKKETTVIGDNLIEIGQFFETALKIGTVLDAAEVPKSKKLIQLQVDVGEEVPRQILAGIREFYTPEELINTQVCVVANLKPAKLMGLLSEGMLLAAKDEDGLCLIRPQNPRKAGTPIG